MDKIAAGLAIPLAEGYLVGFLTGSAFQVNLIYTMVELL